MPALLGSAHAVGATGGAMGVDETGTDSSLKGSDYRSDVTSDQYNRLHTSSTSGGYPVAVDDTVPSDAVMAAATKHGGELV